MGRRPRPAEQLAAAERGAARCRCLQRAGLCLGVPWHRARGVHRWWCLAGRGPGPPALPLPPSCPLRTGASSPRGVAGCTPWREAGEGSAPCLFPAMRRRRGALPFLGGARHPAGPGWRRGCCRSPHLFGIEGGSAGWKRLLGRGIVFCALRCSISLKRDSCDCFQMRASSLPAGWGGCGKLRDGNQNPDQMYRVSGSTAHIWPRRAGTAAAHGRRRSSCAGSRGLSAAGHELGLLVSGGRPAPPVPPHGDQHPRHRARDVGKEDPTPGP